MFFSYPKHRTWPYYLRNNNSPFLKYTMCEHFFVHKFTARLGVIVATNSYSLSHSVVCETPSLYCYTALVWCTLRTLVGCITLPATTIYVRRGERIWALTQFHKASYSSSTVHFQRQMETFNTAGLLISEVFGLLLHVNGSVYLRISCQTVTIGCAAF